MEKFKKYTIAWLHLKALMVKEFLAVLRDPKSRITLIAPPLIQLVIFSHAATLEVTNISIGIYNQDQGWYSHELTERIKGSPYFRHVYQYSSPEEVKKGINNQDVLASLNFQPNFSRLVSSQRTAPVQIILDGRKSNASQIVLGYLNGIVEKFNKEILKSKGIQVTDPLSLEYRSFFNPNIEYIYYTAPSLVAILSMVLALTLTAMSVSRERENGTFDQLLVSPLQPWQILIGKMTPAMLISLFESTLITIASLLLFDIPFKGSILLLYFSMIIFLFSMVGVGLFISSICHTQQQSILGSFVFMVPTMLLSGYATPIENMPSWLQPFTEIIPIKYFFIVIRGIFLKDMSTMDVLQNTWPMALIAIFTLTAADWMFKRRLE